MGREGGGVSGKSSSPTKPLHFCPRVKGVLWGNILQALPQPASTLNSLGEHSSSPALAFTGISWGAFLKPCPNPRRAPWGRIPAALSLCFPLPISLLLPCSLSQALAFLRSPALVRSIAPIASGTLGNPYLCTPLAHCSGHSLSAWKGVIPLIDGGRQWPTLIEVACNIFLFLSVYWAWSMSSSNVFTLYLVCFVSLLSMILFHCSIREKFNENQKTHAR